MRTTPGRQRGEGRRVTVMRLFRASLFFVVLAALAMSAKAAQTNVAVAANFTEPAKEVAALFKQKTGDEAILSFGASGAFFTQIAHEAPFQVFLSADAERPKAAVDQGFAVAGTQFTYAIGKLVLWSRETLIDRGLRPLLIGGQEHLKR